MRDIIFTFFNYFVFFYTSMLAIFFVTFAFLSFISLKRRKDYYVESYMRKTIKESPYTPGISVIAPAFNEEKTIIDNVNSMLALEYPLFEVVIVNDGSTDSTLKKMIEHYELIEVPYAYIERIKTKPFRILAVGQKDLPTWRCFTVNVPVGHEDCSRHLVSTIR